MLHSHTCFYFKKSIIHLVNFIVLMADLFIKSVCMVCRYEWHICSCCCFHICLHLKSPIYTLKMCFENLLRNYIGQIFKKNFKLLCISELHQLVWTATSLLAFSYGISKSFTRYVLIVLVTYPWVMSKHYLHFEQYSSLFSLP